MGVVVDGITIGTNTGQLQDAFDIAQIEVLRGPQGTLFGANTIGGVVSIQPFKAHDAAGPQGRSSPMARWDTWSGKAIANYGDGDDLGRQSMVFPQRRPMAFTTTSPAIRARVGAKATTMVQALLFKPAGSAFDAQLTVRKRGAEHLIRWSATSPIPAKYFARFEPARECDRNTTTDLYTTFGAYAASNYHAPAATLNMNYDLGGVKLTSITGWRHSREEQTQDFDGSSTDLYYVDRRQHYTQWSQELRASGKLFDGFDYVVGGYLLQIKI